MHSKSGITAYLLESQDPSMWSLLGSNLLVIFLAVFQGWSVVTIMLIYWTQSVIIGFFTFVRILTLKEFSLGNLKTQELHIESTIATKIFFAFFFAILIITSCIHNLL